MNIELITQILILALASSLISTQLIQRVKENLNITNRIVLAVTSFLFSFATGIFFTLSFSELKKEDALWVGVIAYAGAEIIYQNFRKKLGLKSLSELEKEEENIEKSLD